MGLTFKQGTVAGPTGLKEAVNFLVDSGASYSLLPKKVWEQLNLSPKRRMGFTLADGTVIERNISECHLTIDEGEAHTPVVLGEEIDEALLGVVFLEILGMILNPFTRELQPMKLMLA